LKDGLDSNIITAGSVPILRKLLESIRPKKPIKYRIYWFLKKSWEDCFLFSLRHIQNKISNYIYGSNKIKKMTVGSNRITQKHTFDQDHYANYRIYFLNNRGMPLTESAIFWYFQKKRLLRTAELTSAQAKNKKTGILLHSGTLGYGKKNRPTKTS
jgi:hypothetical protein